MMMMMMVLMMMIIMTMMMMMDDMYTFYCSGFDYFGNPQFLTLDDGGKGPAYISLPMEPSFTFLESQSLDSFLCGYPGPYDQAGRCL